MFWDVSIQTDNVKAARKPDLVVVYKIEEKVTDITN